jgi:hypothetical protein
VNKKRKFFCANLIENKIPAKRTEIETNLICLLDARECEKTKRFHLTSTKRKKK